MDKTDKNPISSFDRSFLAIVGIIFLAAIAYGIYYYHDRHQDGLVARQVYREMLVIDKHLDNLENIAESIIDQKQLNDQISQVVDQITADDFVSQRENLDKLVHQINYNPVTQAKFESAVIFLNSESKEPKLLQRHLKLLRLGVRELKYQQNHEANDFKKQTANISDKINALKNQTEHIHDEDLQELELAKLRFLSKKLAKITHTLNSALYNYLVYNDLNAAIVNATESS